MFTYKPVQNLFVPSKGQEYRFIGVPASKHGNLSLLIGTRRWNGTDADRARLAKNNVFKTFKEAAAVRESIVAALKKAQTPPIPQTITQGGRTYKLVG